MIKKMLVGFTASLLVLSLAAPAHSLQTPRLPRGDSFWTVSSDSTKIFKINPVTGKRLKTIKVKRLNESITGAAWDSTRRQFAFVDGWDFQSFTNAGQGLITYSLRTKKWKRYTLDFGTEGNEGFDVRDVVITPQGNYWFVVSPWDLVPSANILYGASSPAPGDTSIDMANADIVTVGSPDSLLFSSIAFDPNGSVMVAAEYEYGLKSIGQDGAVVDSQSMYVSPEQASHFDLSSDGSFWVYGEYGAELSWGVLGSPSEQQYVRAPSCSSGCSEIFFIQRGR